MDEIAISEEVKKQVDKTIEDAEEYYSKSIKELQRRIDSGEIEMPEPSKPTTTYTSTSTIDIESLKNGLKLTKPPKNKLTEITDWGTLTKVLQTPGVAIIYSEDSDITVVVDKKCVNIKIEL